ncbi:hypothetical protein D0T50_06315 [Bacteroides sp. 214]|uniref:hypothetical protein n=1 Tax=Bacteroides sp. 214 TaxID=2302935 RepID=UPI0013D7C776|nr:hypothetical protein [Bacteroides sp. 214]NDW12503.1 hypothetical protein [Bacteroides sp. 214]
MKRIMITLIAIGFTAMCGTSVAAMSTNKVRKETRFLTDKMAYELNLNAMQYNDVYEINYDFISSARYVMDELVSGYGWAMDEYYYLLDLRNDDLRYVLSDWQYRRFMNVNYFYRPIYTSGNKWQFRVYITYTNRNYFYFGKPSIYVSYKGGHYRHHYNDISYYKGRYSHTHYSRPVYTRNSNSYKATRRSDFSSVNIRPNTERPSTSRATTLRSSSSSTTRSSNRNTGSSSVKASDLTPRRSGSNDSGTNSSRSSSNNRESTKSDRGSTRTNRESTRTTTTTKSNSTTTTKSSTDTNSSRSDRKKETTATSRSNSDNKNSESSSSSVRNNSSRRSKSSSSGSTRSSSSRSSGGSSTRSSGR